MGLESNAAVRTTHWEMLRTVFCGVRRVSRSEEENGAQERLDWLW